MTRKEPNHATEDDIGAPRLIPQRREHPEAPGQDATNPRGAGAKRGQSDKAEG